MNRNGFNRIKMKQHKRRNLNVFVTIHYSVFPLESESVFYYNQNKIIFFSNILNPGQHSFNSISFNGHFITDFGSILRSTKLSKYPCYFPNIHSAQFLLFILLKIKSNPN